MKPEVPALPETLLAHTGWMRRLARTLVRDDAQADDVVQDAVVAAMRSPPRDPVALPAWLATAVKNGARQLWRGESRRTAREAIVARPEAAPAAAEVVARAEEHGLVVQAVLALEEPYRSALLLRFFDDLPPREIAQRLGVPVETARARVRRGVEQLRARLDASHGGDGRAWRLALVPLTFHHGLTAGAGAGSGTGVAAGSNLTTGAFIMAGSGTMAAVGGLALVIGIAGGWWLGATKSDAIAVDHARQIAEARAESAKYQRQVEQQTAESTRQAGAFRELQGKFQKQEKDFESLTKSFTEVTASLTQTREALEKLSPAPKAPAAKGPKFAFGEFDKLSAVDWKAVGDNLAALAPLCDEIATALAKGEDLPPGATGKASQHNGVLITAALTIAGQIPGSGPNGSYTHPAFMVNAIAATLEAAGKPLTAEETAALEKLGREYSDEDARRLQSYTGETFALAKTIDETDLRRRFFDAAFAALTPEQRNALVPPSVKGLLGMDFFSETLVWVAYLRPMSFKDTSALAESASDAMQRGLRLPPEQAAAVRATADRWVHDLPAALVDPASESRLRGGHVQADTLRLAAVQTLSLVRSVVKDLKLEGAQLEAARKWPALLLLMPTKDEE